MPKASVNDINLYYEIYGKGEPIIFITGFNADRTIWSNIIDHYAETHQVIIIDNRGCGQSDSPDLPYTIEMMAYDTAELCKALNINSSHFIGVSMGGAITQMLAFKYPQLVRSATLCNTFTQIDIKFALFAQGRLELFKIDISPLAMMQSVLGWVFSSEFLNQEGMVDFIIETSLSKSPATTETGYRNQLHALLAFNSESWIHQIKAPCLVIGSDQDMIVSESHMRNIASQIPNALYHCFKGAGHLPHIEQTDAFNQVVRKFLL